MRRCRISDGDRAVHAACLRAASPAPARTVASRATVPGVSRPTLLYSTHSTYVYNIRMTHRVNTVPYRRVIVAAENADTSHAVNLYRYSTYIGIQYGTRTVLVPVPTVPTYQYSTSISIISEQSAPPICIAVLFSLQPQLD